VANRMSIGLTWLWYDATNIPITAQYNYGIRGKNKLITAGDNGKGGEWLDMHLNWRYVF
jgi:hypothetical protein